MKKKKPTEIVTVKVIKEPQYNIVICTTETPVSPENLRDNLSQYPTLADVAIDWGTESEVYLQAHAIFSQRSPLFNHGSHLLVYHMKGTVKTILQAILVIEPLVDVLGYLVAGYTPSAAEYFEAASYLTPFGKFLGVSSNKPEDVTPGGLFTVVNPHIVMAAFPFLYTIGSQSTARIALAAAFVMILSQMLYPLEDRP